MKSISHFSDSIQTQKYFSFQKSTLWRIWGGSGPIVLITKKNTFAHSLTCNSQLARGGIFVCLASNLSSILKVGVLSMENLVAPILIISNLENQFPRLSINDNLNSSILQVDLLAISEDCQS